MRTSAEETAIRRRGIKLTNPLAKSLGLLYDSVPKAVLAAVAVDLLDSHYGCKGLVVDGKPLPDDEVAKNRQGALVAEWLALATKGLVPQSPPKDWRNEDTGRRY